MTYRQKLDDLQVNDSPFWSMFELARERDLKWGDVLGLLLIAGFHGLYCTAIAAWIFAIFCGITGTIGYFIVIYSAICVFTGGILPAYDYDTLQKARMLRNIEKDCEQHTRAASLRLANLVKSKRDEIEAALKEGKPYVLEFEGHSFNITGKNAELVE